MKRLSAALFSASALLAGSALVAQGPQPIPPLPPAPVPPQNPITPAKTILGKLLFWEEQMSTDNRVACGTCHTFEAGGGDLRRARHPGLDGIFGNADDKFGSPGIRRSDANNDYMPDGDFDLEVQVTGRATPTMITAAWFPELFWDGRAGRTFLDPATGQTSIPNGGALENQAIAPILAGNEMAHDARTWAQATTKLVAAQPMALATNLTPDMAAAIGGGESYPDLFQAAFGTPAITAERIAYALATYQRTLVADQTPWDRFNAGQQNALTQAQRRGLGVFTGPGRCAVCHSDALFSDGSYRNLGLRPIAEDNGRQGVTGRVQDRGKFKVPSLRNVGLRRSFMHDGRFQTLQQVVQFYAGRGGPFLDNKDPVLNQIGFPPPAGADLENFLRNALTDPRVTAGTFPFDRPTLRSEQLPPAGDIYGGPTVGTGAVLPRMIAGVPANVGNSQFKVGIHQARGGSLAALLVTPFQGLSVEFGATVLVDLGSSAVFFTPLGGAAGAPGAGYGTQQFPIPNDPGLAGLTAYTQWLVFDSGSAGGFAATEGARVDLF
ncbi:MAG: hypothetical protein NXI31_09725 [bacterium]|nr:hypothetical protein [bacterium]